VRKVASLAIINEDQREAHGEEETLDSSYLGVKRIIPVSHGDRRHDHKYRHPKSKVELKYKNYVK